jgi:hypothetical protein
LSTGPPITPSSGSQRGNGPGIRIPDHGHRGFVINLTYEGQLLQHQVTADMAVATLIEDAAGVYNLVAHDTVLVLFGANPRKLIRGNVLSDPPTVGPGATVLVMVISGLSPRGTPPVGGRGEALYQNGQNQMMAFANNGGGSKLLGNFKLPKFDGTARHWKNWDKTLVRFLSIHQLDQVLSETFMDSLPLSPQDFAANKMVYYILEDAITPGSLAAKYLRTAAKWNGNQAYTKLHDGYVFSGPQTMAILLGELYNLRFLASESASGFCLRLRELFEDLEMVPGSSAIMMNDTQKIGYLLSGIRPEKSLQAVYVALQDKQLRGAITFEDACEDLHHRCEAIRADELLSTPVREAKVLVSTQAKRQNKDGLEVEQGPCLEKGCHELVRVHLPLCPLHYHQCISGKSPEVELKDGLGIAKFDSSTQRIVYPPTVPTNRLPKPRVNGAVKVRKALVSLGITGHLSLVPTSIVNGRPMLLNAIEETKPSSEDGIPSSSLTTFFVDSGAGQCLCSCSFAFITMESCHLQVVGIAGSMIIHGQGTAVFIVSVDGGEFLLRIHNCLHSYGEFNLISVSQLKMVSGNLLDFSVENPFITFSKSKSSDANLLCPEVLDVPLEIDDGLYALSLEPITPNDPRFSSLPSYDVTLPGLFVPAALTLGAISMRSSDGAVGGETMSPPWTTAVLSPSTGRVLAMSATLDFDEELRAFSDGFLAPAAIPPSRRQYNTSKLSDMADLSIRFMGAGTDRLLHTVGISNGLAKPPTKKFDRVPPKIFPQGNLKRSKTPVVAKGKVGNIHFAAIAEVLYTDTFHSGDARYPYGQAFMDHASRWGDIIPIRSRTAVGDAFVTYTCRHYTPLILISDNIAENKGGSLADECRVRSVRQAFTCPHHPQQDRAEGYLGRLTTMASFGMVFAGAPLFMWIWAIRTAVFLNNITACYFSRERVWATPYELLHGEPFPDASIVVPFGCAALVLLDQQDLAKFKSRCALMVFIHYADEHPLYTYAFYSPRTKRVIYRQDCIFLPTVFPMRKARQAAGMIPDGEQLLPFRSPLCMREGSDPAYSFEDWNHPDPLPAYEDHVLGVKLTRPNSDGTNVAHPAQVEEDLDPHFPSHPAFGPQSVVQVRFPTGLRGGTPRVDILSNSSSSNETRVPETTGSTPASNALGVLVGPTSNRTGPMDFRFLPMPPPHHRIFQYGGPLGTAFTVTLHFEVELGRPSQRYRVYATMPVRVLHYRISLQVLRIDPRGIRMYVNGSILFHQGTISDRNRPGAPAIATPYLVPNSRVDVRLHPFGPVGPAALIEQVPLPPDEGEGDDADIVPLIEDSPPPVDDDGEIEEGEDDPDGVSDAPGETTITPDGEVIEITYVDTPPPRRVSTRVRAPRNF